MHIYPYQHCCTGTILYGFTASTSVEAAKNELFTLLKKCDRDWMNDGHFSAVTRDGCMENVYGKMFTELGATRHGPYKSKRHSSTTFHYSISRECVEVFYKEYEKIDKEREKKLKEMDEQYALFLEKVTQDLKKVKENA